MRVTSFVRAGFTLIELLVVMTIFGFLLITATGLFFTLFVGQDKTSSGIIVKQQGDYALSQILTMIRSGAGIDSCTSSSLVVRNRDTKTTQFFAENNKIASNSGTYLTSQDLTVTDGPTFTCTNDDAGQISLVSVTFTLRKGDPAVDKARDIVTQVFAGSAGLRSY